MWVKDMDYSSLTFLFLLPFAVGIYFGIPDRFKYIWLLILSYLFCFSWGTRAVIFLAVVTIFSYGAGLLIEYFDKKRRIKRVVFILGILACIGFWIFSKGSTLLFRSQIETIESFLILPVGISFYSLQAVGYLIDIYKGKEAAEHNFFKVALYLAFFPKFVSGPLEKSSFFFAQLNNIHNKKFQYERVKNGILLMMWGYLQKLLIADKLLIPVNEIYDNWQMYSGTMICIGTILFAVQLYADFGGYTCIALGIGEILGIELHNNFKQPYLADSVKDFWRRWHISLSGWLREYIYIPLGGNRKGRLCKCRNILLTFVVSGFWHGTSWRFIVWGMLHGIYQIMGKVCNPLRNKVYKILHINSNNKICAVWKKMCVFILVDIAWLFFRADGLKTALQMLYKCVEDIQFANILKKLFFLGLKAEEVYIVLGAMAILVLVDILHEKNIEIRKWLSNQNIALRWGCYLSVAFVLIIAMMGKIGGTATQFVYAQF